MPQVEIYKIKKTADPEIRSQGLFELVSPSPENYVREWSGELPSDNLETLCGKFFLNPPDGYHGGPLEKSDIALVNGQAYFLDRARDYKFVAVEFDTTGIKPAMFVEYGRSISEKEAAQIPRTFALVCESLDIPIGYVGEPGYHGTDKGIPKFHPYPDNDYSRCFLHPQFLKGEEARAFVGLLTELSESDRWNEIEDYLRANYPVYMTDLEAARELFAPELLLPSVLKPLSGVIPSDTDKAEINYLADKVSGMCEDDRNIFFAVVEAGWHCANISEIINITENINCFELRPELTAEQYGSWLLDGAQKSAGYIVMRLSQSDNPDERDLATHIELLEASVSVEAYGLAEACAERGVFTSRGYITEESEVQNIYRGVPVADAVLRLASEKESVLDKIRQDWESRATAPPREPKPKNRRKDGPEH